MSDFVFKAAGGQTLAVHSLSHEMVNTAGDTGGYATEIDMCRYADESVPRGYERVVHYNENKSPTSCDQARIAAQRPDMCDMSDQRFDNEKI